MEEESRTYPLVAELIRRARLSWYGLAAAVVGVLFLFFVLAVYFDGAFAELARWGFWQTYLDGPLLIAYILASHVLMWRLRVRAVEAFRPLLRMDEEDFDRLAADVNRPNRRGEWMAVAIGVGFAVALGEPWTLGWGPGALWLSVWLVIVGTLMNGMLAWLIYDTLAGAVRIARLSRRDLTFDILDTKPLEPIDRWSLGISLAFVGGIGLSLVFSTRESLLRWQSITMYVILVGVTVLMFFLSMWGAHKAMAEGKERKLALARKNLVAISRELEGQKEQRQLGGLGEPSSALTSITSWASYQRLVREASTWPFDAGILRRLLASIVMPAIIYLVKILAGAGLRF